ncbi:O-methyltransferase [Treponema sp. JC4]|uniref:methyltransferase n=1 Tax=Treponema sp. JC4 TaxID=1124982 RepID=UPI00025B0222|nr:methyltransferase [Treponema sp. JC4]EID86105.1 O-methyltransferase [Treponema sp. JC4]
MYKKTENKGQDKAIFTPESLKEDDIRAVDAKTHAQEIAFSPMTFQAVRAMLELGILQLIEDAGDSGIKANQLAEKSGVSLYGINLLCEIALGMGVIKLSSDSTFESDERYVLGKTGWMLLEDDLTKANFWFTNDICYQGAWDLLASIKSGKPEGLKVFGDKWTTIYEALSSLPERAKKSWFDFDHFYSDIAFPDALPIVFAKKPAHLVDIGGNTAKWAISCCKYDPDVHVTIMDLPGQTSVAEKNAEAAGFAKRISTQAGNILDQSDLLPAGADAVWMSQFLDCFSLHQITKIAKKIYACVDNKCSVYVLEPLWDKQRFMASSYSLQATSLYFTCMANGNSKMYRYGELVQAIEESGLKLKTAHHNLGSNNYTLLEFSK